MGAGDNQENYSKCICRSCPSYPRGNDRVLYCARGKSEKAVNKVSCTCPGCPVWHENDLNSMYYCVSGQAL